MSEMTLDNALQTMEKVCGYAFNKAYGAHEAMKVIKNHLARAQVQVTDEDVRKAVAAFNECSGDSGYSRIATKMRAAIESTIPLEDRTPCSHDTDYNAGYRNGVVVGWNNAREAMACNIASLSARLAQLVVAKVPDTKPLPDLMLASYHEAVGWNACREAMLSQPHPQAAQGGEVQGEEVVCELAGYVKDGEDGPYINWLGEGGIHDLPDGTPLWLLSGADFETEEGWASLYTHPAEREVVPEGMLLVPSEMRISKQALDCIHTVCGGDDEAVDLDDRWSDGIAWIGNIEEDGGSKRWGLHIMNAEYPEEGSITLAEFAAPTLAGKEKG